MKSHSLSKIWKRKSVVLLKYSSIVNIFVITSVILNACSNSNDFSIGEEFLEPQTNIKIVDTFRVALSTVLLDSLSTSKTGLALVGSYKDDTFGELDCSSYFDFTLPTSQNIEVGAIFDSSALIMSYTGFYYGDTTSLMSIGIHQLAERITPNDNGYLYNTSTFKYSQETLGTKIFYPGPGSSGSQVSIRVDAFGEELFRLFVNKDSRITNNELFLDYVKGFVVTSHGQTNNVVLGFQADADHIILKIYYHIENEFPESNEISITMGNESDQFNSIHHDFAGTYLIKLNADNKELLSAETGNTAFMLASVGLIPKIQFPSLQDIFLENRWKIVTAELIFEPEQSSYNSFALPDKIYLYETDKHNLLGSILTDGNQNAIVATFSLDEEFLEGTSYTFNLTRFINNELSDGYFNSEHSLLIGPTQTEINSTLDRMVIEGKDPPVKLKLYYLTY